MKWGKHNNGRLFIPILLLFLASCNNRLSEVSVCSNLQEGDSISVALYSTIIGQYNTVNGATVTSADAIRNRVDIPLPDSLTQNIFALSISIFCNSDNILTISSIQLNGRLAIYPKDIMKTLWWQDGVMLEMDSQTNTIKSHINKNIPGTFPVGIFVFYQSHRPIGLQLFLRFSFLTTLIIFIFIFYKQIHTQRLLLLSIALFLATLPLLLNYAIYSMALMCLAMFIVFIYNKSCRFIWHPVFYALCAMFLINVIGLIYTVDFNHGLKRIDTIVVFVLFPVIFSMIQFTQKNVVFILRLFVWSVIAFCTFGILSYATIVPELTWDMVFKDNKLYAPLLMMWPAFDHPSVVSIILLMAVPVALYLRYDNSSNFKLQTSNFKIAETLLGVLLPIVFTILCGARIGMLIAPVLLGFGYLFYCKFKPVLKWGLMITGILASFFLLHLFPEINGRFTDTSRMDLQAIAISAIKEKPVFGWGTGSAKMLIHSEDRAHNLGIETPYDLNQFHNQYLEDMAQFGIPGILILLVLFGWILWTGVSEKNFLLLSLLIIYAMVCWVETALFGSKGVLSFSFWFCFLMANRNKL